MGGRKPGTLWIGGVRRHREADAEQPLEAGDELLFVVPAEVEAGLEQLLSPGSHPS